MGGPVASSIDDALRIGLVYHGWPFSTPPGSLRSRDLAYLMERTLALTPRPPAPEDENV